MAKSKKELTEYKITLKVLERTLAIVETEYARLLSAREVLRELKKRADQSGARAVLTERAGA